MCRSGGVYDPEWVRRLERQAYEWGGVHRFCCLSDFDRSAFGPFVGVIPLEMGWPGWWSKLELFKPGLFERGDEILYLDLDTVIVGEFGFLWGAIDSVDLMVLRDFYLADRWATGMMGWTAGRFAEIFAAFQMAAWRLPLERMTGPREGDQDWIRSTFPELSVRLWQDEFPGRVVSWKVDVQGRRLPPRARVVCFHGRPRPSEVDLSCLER